MQIEREAGAVCTVPFCATSLVAVYNKIILMATATEITAKADAQMGHSTAKDAGNKGNKGNLITAATVARTLQLHTSTLRQSRVHQRRWIPIMILLHRLHQLPPQRLLSPLQLQLRLFPAWVSLSWQLRHYQRPRTRTFYDDCRRRRVKPFCRQPTPSRHRATHVVSTNPSVAINVAGHHRLLSTATGLLVVKVTDQQDSEHAVKLPVTIVSKFEAAPVFQGSGRSKRGTDWFCCKCISGHGKFKVKNAHGRAIPYSVQH